MQTLSPSSSKPPGHPSRHPGAPFPPREPYPDVNDRQTADSKIHILYRVRGSEIVAQLQGQQLTSQFANTALTYSRDQVRSTSV